MLIQKIRIRGLLSFNDASLEMRPLNVLIGPNASGKSNLIEVVALLRALPSDLPDFFAKNGPTADWFWKGGPVAGNEHESGGSIKVEITNPLEGNPLRLVLRLSHRSQFPHIDEERLEYARPAHGHTDPYWFFSVTNRYGRIKTYPSEDGDFANPGTLAATTATEPIRQSAPTTCRPGNPSCASAGTLPCILRSAALPESSVQSDSFANGTWEEPPPSEAQHPPPPRRIF